MGQVLLLALILLVAESHGQNPACSIDRCSCASRNNSPSGEVVCSVASITSYDATIKSLTADIKELILFCDGLHLPSVLSDGIFETLPLLRILTILECNISVLTVNSFRGLPSLKALRIDKSILPSMDADTFLHLSTIIALYIRFCSLYKLPDISHLQSLIFLDVSNNNLNEIEFQPITDTENTTQAGYFNNLRKIDLSYNNISSMPTGLLASTPRLLELYLKDLPLTELTIPENTQLKNLKIIDATGSRLVVADLSGLYADSDLMVLRLDGVGQPLHLPGLSRLVNLKELSLTNFAITDTIWQQLNSSHLANLTLINNNLTTINISHLPNLHELNLATNNISRLQDETLSSQVDLTWFNISHNSIQDLPVNIFHTIVTIRYLDLSYNNISSLQTGIFSGLTQLKYLGLNSNSLSSFPDDFFENVSSLQMLSIKNNNLRSLPNLLYLPGLTHLTVSHNQISSISPSDLSGLVNLKLLEISNNRLTRVPRNLLSQCPKLIRADLSRNRIAHLGTFDAHANLISLNLEHNQITDFSRQNTFVHLERLQLLNLDANNLTSLRHNVFPPSLRFLTLEENSLKILDMNFHDLPQLTVVSLINNKAVLLMPWATVSVFNDRLLKPTFIVDNVVFVCHCGMSYLKLISEDNFSIKPFNNLYPVFYGLDNSFCYTPFEGGTIRPFIDVPLSHFACEYTGTWCEDICLCCFYGPKCECALSCPSECKCYYGGSGLKKIYIHIYCRSQNLEQIPNGIPARTVVLYLDGNNLSHLSKQDFSHLQDAEDIYLNNSYIKSTDNGTFENISALKSLSLNDNQLTSIDDNFLGRLPSVKQIYLHNNLIDTISSEAFSQLSSVETITLHNNRLMFLKAVLKIPHPMSLTLSGNPWSCNCDVSKVLMRTFYEVKASIADNEELCCSFHEGSFLSDQDSGTKTFSVANINGNLTAYKSANSTGEEQNLFSTTSPSRSCFPLSDFNYQESCRPARPNRVLSTSNSGLDFHPGFIATIIITIIVLLIAAGVVFVLVKRHELQALVFVKLGVRILDKKVRLDKEDGDQKVFDAFISYSSKDEVFVATNLVPMLEDGDNNVKQARPTTIRSYRLCVHYRDFPVGRDITETIYRAIHNSSRTILLLSMNFLSSEWCRFEFQTAHHHVLREGSHRLIVVILGDVPEEEMDPDLKVQVQSRTYLKYGDRWFWEKLFFAMPSIKGRQVNNGDQRADILQRMEVLAQDEIVDREINLLEQQHNFVDDIVNVEMNLLGQQHNHQAEIVNVEMNLLGQQHNHQAEIVNVEMNLLGQQRNPQAEIVNVEMNLLGQQRNPQEEIVGVEINLVGQQRNHQAEIVGVKMNLVGQQRNHQAEIVGVEMNLLGQQHNHQAEIVGVEMNLLGQQRNPQAEIVGVEMNLLRNNTISL